MITLGLLITYGVGARVGAVFWGRHSVVLPTHQHIVFDETKGITQDLFFVILRLVPGMRPGGSHVSSWMLRHSSIF